MSTRESQKRATRKYLDKIRRLTIDLDPETYEKLHEVACHLGATHAGLVKAMVKESLATIYGGEK